MKRPIRRDLTLIAEVECIKHGKAHGKRQFMMSEKNNGMIMKRNVRCAQVRISVRGAMRGIYKNLKKKTEKGNMCVRRSCELRRCC